VIRATAGSATWLAVEQRHFVRDPRGVLPPDLLLARYDGDVRQLRRDAVDTGYRAGEVALWLGRDRRAAYLVRPRTIERWPSTKEGVACF
jgi:hypothetical protein